MPRLFQNLGISTTYQGFRTWSKGSGKPYGTMIERFLESRYGAPHLLRPILEASPDGFLAVGNFAPFQRAWARDKGIRFTSLEDVLLAQIEDFGAEVFYNCDPLSFGDDFLRRLPGCVRRTIAWSAAPHGNARFFGHDVIVCNFPNILQIYAAQGARTQLFYPAHDPVMDEYARADRDIDVVFAGAYSRHHHARNLMLELVARLADTFNVHLLIQPSRLTRLAETLGWIVPPLMKHRRSKLLRQVTREPRYGRDLYDVLGRAKIVLNGAIGMAEGFRGNLRVWEATGCGALLLSDCGIYPEGFVDRETLAIYNDLPTLVARIREMLGDEAERRSIAVRGNALIRTRYGKDRQWADFQEVCR